VRHASSGHAASEPGTTAGGGREPGGRAARGRHQARVAARAEGPAERPAPQRFAQLPYVAVLVGVAIALVIIQQGVHHVRSGTLVFAGVLLLAALARLVLPERRAGMLSSRRRLLDVAIFGVLGIGLLVGALVVPVPG
jgi:DUF3017 family protein